MLFYERAKARERQQRGDRLTDVNMAFGGGDDAKRLLQDLYAD